MIPFPLVNGHDNESRASTLTTATSLDPEILNHENPSREVHNGFLDLPSASQSHIRYSITEFNEHIDEISADEELLYEGVPTHPPIDSGNTNPVSESLISTDTTCNPTPTPNQRTIHPSNDPPSATSSLLRPKSEEHIHLDTPPQMTASHVPPTTDFSQNSGAESADPHLPHLSTATHPIPTSNPTPTLPSPRTGHPNPSKTDHHRRRFVRWVKKKFRRQLPWSADSLHNETEAERALKRADSQGLSSRRHRKSRGQ